MSLMTDELRGEILKADGARCVIPSCNHQWVDPAHIRASGIGGQRSSYRLKNVAGMCRLHHDIYDGRHIQGRQELLAELLDWVVQRQRADRRAIARPAGNIFTVITPP